MKRLIVFITLAVLVCGSYGYADDKVLFSGDGVLVVDSDLKVEDQFLSSNFQAKKNEKLKVILMNRLFALDAKNTWKDPLLDRKVKIVGEKYVGNLYRKRIKDSIVISQEVLKSYYIANPSQFVRPAEYQLKMIMVSNKFICEKIKDDITTGLRKFSDVAREQSVDEESSARAGLIGWMPINKMPGALLEKVKGFKKGDVTIPFKYNKKWVLLMVNDLKPEKKIEFLMAENDIKNKLLRKEFVKKMNFVFESLKIKYNIR